MTAKQRPLTKSLQHPRQPIGWDGAGVIRFKENPIVRALLDECTNRGGLDLNNIYIDTARGKFAKADMVQLAQLIGYSVSGFGDLDYAPRKMVAEADAEAAALSAMSKPKPRHT